MLKLKVNIESKINKSLFILKRTDKIVTIDELKEWRNNFSEKDIAHMYDEWKRLDEDSYNNCHGYDNYYMIYKLFHTHSLPYKKE